MEASQINRKSKIQNSKFFPPAVILLIATAAACGAAPKPPKGVTPAKVTGPRVEMPSGAVYRVDLARTPEEQARGLMYRESLPEKTGMLFLFSDKGVHQFWMKNTMIPLDMIWMDEAGKVVFISANTPPCKADPCPSYGPKTPISSVLEIAGGMAAKGKVVVGSALKFLDVK